MTEKYRRYQWCPVQEKVVPVEEVVKQNSKAFNYIADEMPPTKSPIDGKMFTSKSKLREQYRQHGAEEIGTAYDNGYIPPKETNESQKALEKRMHERFREHLNRGR